MTSKPSFIPEGYKLVYQGGHHDVYCNGSRHLTTRGGGWTRLTAPVGLHPEYEYKCNCEEFSARPAA